MDNGAGVVDGGFEVVEVEVIGLTKILELPLLLSGEDGGRTGAEAAVVDARDGGVVVAEFRLNF